MKISKYSFLFDIDKQEFYIYNTLSNALMEIDVQTYEAIGLIKKGVKEIDVADFDKDLLEALRSNNFLTESDTDDFLAYKAIIMRQRNQRGSMHLTLAPTMDCCFRCHYCFEKYKEKNYMTPEVMDAVIKYVTSWKDLQHLSLTWFGGEPLMAPKQIEEFYNKLTAVWDKPVSSNIITTGYHINEETVRVMQAAKITSMQITLDGMKDNHNKIKYLDECDDVFSKVIDNIGFILAKAPDIHVAIRVNLTKENSAEFHELHKFLTDKFGKHKNFAVSPAFVLDRGASSITEEDKAGLLFNHKDRSEYILNLINGHGIDNPFIRYPDRFFKECAIRNDLAISFDPEGYAYKCWEVIGNKEYAIGKLNEEGALTEINETVLNRQLFGADPIDDPVCKKCVYLPICNGGCPIQRIQNEFEGGKNCCCTYYKGYMDDFLKVHLRLKKAGFANQFNYNPSEKAEAQQEA